MGYQKKYAGLPFVYDDDGEIVGLLNDRGELRLFLLALPVVGVPVDGAFATLDVDMTADNADITLTAVEAGAAGNQISIGFLDPSDDLVPLSVVVAGTAISVTLETDDEGEIVSTANEVIAAINAHPMASRLVTAAATGEQTGEGVVNAVAADSLESGATATAGPVKVLMFDTDSGDIYQKISSVAWMKILAAPALPLPD